MLARFGIQSRLEYYSIELLSMIIQRSARVLGVAIYEDAAIEIARRSRGTQELPMLLRRVRDFAEIKGNGEIEIKITKYALDSLNVDEFGLDEMDNKIMRVMIENFKGKPVGISALATSIGENPETLEEVYEPFLIQEGFIIRTPRGREVTDKAYQHLNISRPKNPEILRIVGSKF
jgi:Holliday junction DNA helicase RuvB